MKELIEKIKELQDVFKFHCCQVTCEQIIGMIQKQESKPFDPVEAGFFITETTLRILREDINIDILEFDFKKDQKTYLIRLFKKESKIWIQHKYAGEENYKMLVDLIKIPNHRQGVELLRNLGVIDADWNIKRKIETISKIR